MVGEQGKVPQRPVGGHPPHRRHAVRRQGLPQSHQDEGVFRKDGNYRGGLIQ